jgi:nucleotide-binding universal stress UspA family protein
MAGSISGGTTPPTEPAALTAEAPEVTHVVVPLDGSPFAERALPVAGWVAAELGAGVHPVEIVHDDEEAEGAVRYLDSVCRRHHATQWDVVQRDDVPGALAETVARSPARMACMATHGWDRSAAPLGSVASGLLDRSDRPMVLVGRGARALTAADAPVVVAVDGAQQDDALVSVALGWAAKLARPVEIVTVALPPTASRAAASPRHAESPAEPEKYVESLAARAAGEGPAVSARVAYDPVSVRDGLVPLLDRTAALVVVGSRHRPAGPGAIVDSDAARIVNDAPVPAVVVPFPAGA